MNRNFAFDQFTVVRWNDHLIDLHNLYDLKHFGTDLGGETVTLEFIRIRYASDQPSLPPRVTLRCGGNARIAFNDLNLIETPLDGEGIEIAYFDRNCEDWDEFIDEHAAIGQEPLGLHVTFANGLAMRIFCEVVTFAAH